MSGAPGAGRLIAVVGPSGVGKDSLIAVLVRRRPALERVRRVITRPAEAGGEEFCAVDAAEFGRREAAGAFALAWAAHGLRYGVPASVGAVLERPADALVNLSRGVLAAARTRFPTLVVLSVTAAPEVLAARLAGRGRETATEIARRLERPGAALPPGLRLIPVDNGGTLEAAADQALHALYPPSG